MTDDVLILATDANVGRIRLNRPKAIHALTREMCDAMIDALLDMARRSDDPGGASSTMPRAAASAPAATS